MKSIRNLSIAVAALIVLAAILIYTGAFSVAADDPHWSVTRGVLETIRERSIASRAGDVQPPASLDDPQLIAIGAEHYAEMCTGCHLAPGMEDTEIRAGLNPRPPNLAEHGMHDGPAETFWIIKHGIKMTGMPAWGPTHDDRTIWGMVAFIKQLPGMTPAKYAELTAGSEEEESHDHAHHHDDSGSHEHEESMPQAQRP